MSSDIKAKDKSLIECYFSLIKNLRNGDASAVDSLMGLWSDDGIFEFAGAPPVTGKFEGKNAIRTLYTNRMKAGGMALQLHGPSVQTTSAGPSKEAALGVVDTEVHGIRALNGKVVAGWTTLVSTSDSEGFHVSGSHTFSLQNGKITALKVVVSPKADVAPNISMKNLSVEDIGRLSLAAWAVV